MSASDSEEGGESYFASVSDLMVGILFVFLLMLTVFALNFHDAEDDQKVERSKLVAAQAEAEQSRHAADEAKLEAELAKSQARQERLNAINEKQRAELKEREADEQKARNAQLQALLRKAVEQMKQDIADRQNARERLLNTLEGRLKKDGLTVMVDPDSGVLRLPEQLLFAKGSPSLDPSASSSLQKLAAALSDVLPCFADSSQAEHCGEGDKTVLESVLIEGHSDSQGYHDNGKAVPAEEARDRNDRLATDRSLNVFKELLRRNGLDSLRNAGGQLLFGVSAYGDRRPIAAGDTPEAYQKNRRIDLRFLLSPKTSSELERLINEIRPALQGEQ